MLQQDPWRQRLTKRITWVMILYCVLAVFYLGLNTFEYVSEPRQHTISTFIPSFFFVLSALIFVFMRVLIGTVFKRRTAKRQQALAGDQSLLAEEQPAANAQAISIPVTIELRMKWTLFYMMAAGYILTTIILGTIFLITKPLSTQGTLIFLAVIAGATVFFLLILLLGAWIGTKRNRQSVTVTEQDITTRYLGKTTTIAWSEARFFCMNGVAKQKRALVYELSGENKSVLWTRLFAPKGYIKTAMLRPTVPFEEYDKKSQALLEIVAGKTGLKLYDLRDTTNKWYM